MGERTRYTFDEYDGSAAGVGCLEDRKLFPGDEEESGAQDALSGLAVNNNWRENRNPLGGYFEEAEQSLVEDDQTVALDAFSGLALNNDWRDHNDQLGGNFEDAEQSLAEDDQTGALDAFSGLTLNNDWRDHNNQASDDRRDEESVDVEETECDEQLSDALSDLATAIGVQGYNEMNPVELLQQASYLISKLKKNIIRNNAPSASCPSAATECSDNVALGYYGEVASRPQYQQHYVDQYEDDQPNLTSQRPLIL